MSLPRLLDPRPAAPLQPLPGGVASLRRARVHEICGTSRLALAAMVMELSEGPVLWVFPGWLNGRIFPDGLLDFADPARVVFVRTRRPEEILWTVEETLRSGAVPLVVAEVATVPALTPVRRMNLAAEAGTEAAHHWGRIAPLGLLLTPGDGGAAGVESRWRMDAIPSGSTLIERHQAWRMQRLRARDAGPGAWTVSRDEDNQTTVARLPD
ncbi:hypothetical protein LHP98_09490 [Rhodobacter sp. Har01]|uniref:ImuA family protein n=1 Tax=Rhodobacter sp. Har01 TaxID=2883999 RepID=UPI001D07AD5B|nr:hypothetical protein [Rhodobacter sp. Har01]MCB6178361.1 hypothetical protein [Rhodobacter sp. Har01]